MEKTREGFRRLPVLLRLGAVCEWTGIERHTLSEMVRSGELRVYRPKAKAGRRVARGYFYRDEIARLVKWA